MQKMYQSAVPPQGQSGNMPSNPMKTASSSVQEDTGPSIEEVD